VALSIEIYLKLKKDQGIKKNYLGQRYHLCFCRRPKSTPYNGPSILCRKSLTLCKRLTSLRDSDDVISQPKWSPRTTLRASTTLFNSLLTWNFAEDYRAWCYFFMLSNPITALIMCIINKRLFILKLMGVSVGATVAASITIEILGTWIAENYLLKV
jgi:hypothetical protein